MQLAMDMGITHNDDYQRIAAAIAFMRQHHLSQPNLETIAHHVNLSEYHFQRLFSQWAGISPKRFLQFLTVEYAKSKIAETRNLLDLTLDIGLSSPGRLHDLFVTLEAMSPGEFKSAGTGLQIRYGVHNTPFGSLLIATTTRGVCNIQFLDETTAVDAPFDPQPNAQLDAQSRLQREWPNAEIVPDSIATQPICDQLFNLNGLDKPKPLTLLVKGTNFQIQVWRALLTIPFGSMATYQTVATAIARPTATRAIGNAIGNNPIAYLIPCHRVIRESGELGGYRWGITRKSALLGWEASQLASKE